MRRQAVENGVAAGRVAVVHGSIAGTSPPPPGTRTSVREELSIPPDALVVLQVARVERWKGQLETAQAFEALRERHPSAHLVIAGEGNDLSPLQQAVAQMASSKRIHILGYRSDIPQLLVAADIFCHPSREEAFGAAVAEASSCGLPVVAWADGALPELIAEGETGLLAPVGEVHALTGHLDRLLSDGPLRRRMGTAGRQRMVSRFSPITAAQEYSALLRRVMIA